MPRDSGGVRYYIRLILTLAVLLMGLGIFIINFVAVVTDMENRKEVSKMKAQIDKTSDKKGSEVFVAITGNAETDNKISDAELTALRYQYKTFLDKRYPETGVKINNKDEIRGTQ